MLTEEYKERAIRYLKELTPEQIVEVLLSIGSSKIINDDNDDNGDFKRDIRRV